jgi:molybdate transport system substrate-binding protein
MRRTTLAVLVASAVALLAPAAAQALSVYGATSLTNVFPAIDKSPTYSFGGSNTLQLQIERGAPADVFASASPTEAQALFREGLCTRPVTFAINRLVVLIPNANPGNVRSVYSLRSGGRRVSIGTAGVPIGAYTRQLLKRMRLSSILSSNTVSQQTNVGQVVSQVALGAADAGFVYYTDGLAAKDRTKMLSLPKWAQPPVRYQICAVKRAGADTSGAAAFIKKVVGPSGRAALKGYGFGLPPRK